MNQFINNKGKESIVPETLENNIQKSLILKLYLLNKHGYITPLSMINTEIITLSSFLDEYPLLKSIFSNYEEYKIMEKEFKTINVMEVFSKIKKYTSDITFCIAFLHDQKKQKGQYYTNEKLVKKIQSLLELEKENDKHSSIIDFSAGIGLFLHLSKKMKKILRYGVELDDHSFEFMILDFILDKNIHEQEKMKLLLTLKKGDALQGYDRDILKTILEDKKKREILREIKKKREKLLYDKEIINYEKILEIEQLRSSFSSSFNWFIDFPEIFLTDELELSSTHGFSYVIGNPPWLIYNKNNSQYYDKTVNSAPFDTLKKGKYNFSLLFAILSLDLAKEKGALIVPLGLLTETYGMNWRRVIVKEYGLKKIVIGSKQWFFDVSNEYCIIMWNKKELNSDIECTLEEEKSFFVSKNSIRQPLYKFPLFSKELQEFLLLLTPENSMTLDAICSIRRGFTLTKAYKEVYDKGMNTQRLESKKQKELLNKNIFDPSGTIKGIFNFQIFNSNEYFIYDTILLGSSGSEELFEQRKIIRRNRGKEWTIGLDNKGKIYCNDIFDIIVVNTPHYTIEMIFGYLCSSLIQFFAENFLQRDITSNFVRSFPVLKLTPEQWKNIHSYVVNWLKSKKSYGDFIELRSNVDQIVSSVLPSHDFYEIIQKQSKINWRS